MSHVDFVSFSSLRIQELSEETPPMPMSLFLRPRLHCALIPIPLISSRIFLQHLPHLSLSFSPEIIPITTHILYFSIFKKTCLDFTLPLLSFFVLFYRKKKYPKNCLYSLTLIQFLSRRPLQSVSAPPLHSCLGHQALTSPLICPISHLRHS